jgi:hypothetical protein
MRFPRVAVPVDHDDATGDDDRDRVQRYDFRNAEFTLG